VAVLIIVPELASTSTVIAREPDVASDIVPIVQVTV
jgi:hypothetical protein